MSPFTPATFNCLIATWGKRLLYWGSPAAVRETVRPGKSANEKGPPSPAHEHPLLGLKAQTYWRGNALNAPLRWDFFSLLFKKGAQTTISLNITVRISSVQERNFSVVSRSIVYSAGNNFCEGRTAWFLTFVKPKHHVHGAKWCSKLSLHDLAKMMTAN